MHTLDFSVLPPHVHGFYTIAYDNIPFKEEYQSTQLWHHRLGHLHFDISKKWFTMVQLQVFIPQLKNQLNCVLLVNLGR